MKTINYLFLLFCGTLLSFTGFSQSECYTENEEPIYFKSSLICSELEDYSPINSDEAPIITVRVDFHIFQKNDGTGNFQNSPSDIAALEDFVDKINYRLSHLDILNIGSSNYI